MEERSWNGARTGTRIDLQKQKNSQILQSISNNDKVFRTLQLILRKALNKNNDSRSVELNSLKAELSVYQNRMEKAQHLVLDGNLSFTDFQPVRLKIEPEIEKLTEQIRAIEKLKSSDEQEVIEFGFRFISNLGKLFTVADLELKRQIIGSTFPKK